MVTYKQKLKWRNNMWLIFKKNMQNHYQHESLMNTKKSLKDVIMFHSKMEFSWLRLSLSHNVTIRMRRNLKKVHVIFGKTDQRIFKFKVTSVRLIYKSSEDFHNIYNTSG